MLEDCGVAERRDDNINIGQRKSEIGDRVVVDGGDFGTARSKSFNCGVAGSLSGNEESVVSFVSKIGQHEGGISSFLPGASR